MKKIIVLNFLCLFLMSSSFASKIIRKSFQEIMERIEKEAETTVTLEELKVLVLEELRLKRTEKRLIKEKNTNKKKENTQSTHFSHCLKRAKKELNATLTDQEDKVLLTSIYKQMLNNNINVESIFSIKKDAELTHIFKQSSLKSRLMYLNDECEGLIVEIAKLKSKNILNKKEQSTLSQLKKELTTALSKKNKLEEALLINDICKTDNAANKPLNMQHIKALMAAHGATLDTSKSFTFALKNT